VARLREQARRHGLDLLITVAAVAGALEVVLRRDEPLAPTTTPWLTAPAVALLVLVLLGHRRSPFAAPVTVWLLAAAFSFVDGRLVVFPFTAYAAGLGAAYLLGAVRDGRQARLGLVVAVGGAVIVMGNSPDTVVSDVVLVPALFGLAWLGGAAQRQRTARAEAAEEHVLRAEREREVAARIAVAEERARVARELHDVVAHAVSVMVLQVGAVRHRLPETLEQEKEALRGVEHAGRTALTEMRRLLGALRHDGDDLELVPQPGLGGLDSLLEEFERAGLPVRLHIDGEPFALPRGIDLSAYRIVQEGLTNALKHARASHANVLVRYGSDDLQVEVCDDGDGTSTDHGLGHGLIGVRERVTIYGGEMTAGSANAGGFALRTRLPLDGHRR
jgi:signal transduction histidine kinase